ncbi:MAG: DAK2 domain-containing protein, partial [Atopostipes sp.]|nr:DAK2 domain-containing protein [Atopostipes sp.]
MVDIQIKDNEMNSEEIYYSFISGANEVIKEKMELNRINVFPIADGDTGSNLAYTMNSIIENAEILETPKETLASIADAALMGARGNSGIIFAQFVNGMYMEMVEEDTIALDDFAHSINRAGDYAYEAIANPVEGTMVTVISDWAHSLSNLAETTIDFKDMLANSLKAALESLSRTPEKLEVLKEANVVDSGAKGFVHFIEGFSQFLQTGKVEDLRSALGKIEFNDEAMDVHENFDLNYRYCVEGILQGENLRLEEMKETLETMGDSLIMAGNNQKMRLHIHTNDPEELFYFLKDYGKITFQKAD